MKNSKLILTVFAILAASLLTDSIIARGGHGGGGRGGHGGGRGGRGGRGGGGHHARAGSRGRGGHAGARGRGRGRSGRSWGRGGWGRGFGYGGGWGWGAGWGGWGFYGPLALAAGFAIVTNATYGRAFYNSTTNCFIYQQGDENNVTWYNSCTGETRNEPWFN